LSEIEAARKLLADLREVKKAVMKLMESENEDTKVFAVDAFTKLAEMEIVLLEALSGESHKEQRNPLARRVRIAG
jgi:hypothetical protein